MNQSELKKYINPRRATEIQQICKPLFYRTPINGYQFTRIYNDGSRIHLGSDANWSELLFNKKLYLQVKLENHPDCHKSGAYIWDHWDRDCPSYLKCGKIAEDFFNHAHGLSIVKRYDTHRDITDLSSPTTYLNSDDFYTTNIDLLYSFVDHFMEAATPLIKNAENHKFKLRYPHDHNLCKQYSDIDRGLIKNKSPDNLLANQLYAKLTNKEKQILSWLFQGKTSSEIAIILEKSPRTVEKFIPRLKTKYNCDTLFQLGATLGPLQHRIMLEELLHLAT